MDDYLGVVVEQSLAAGADSLPVIAARTGAEWTLLLVRVAVAAFDDHVRWLRRALVADEPWYAHYWRGQELVVVFGDAVFEVSVDEGSWAEVVEHGLARGVPAEQLDFEPRTVADAEALFGIRLGAPVRRRLMSFRTEPRLSSD